MKNLIIAIIAAFTVCAGTATGATVYVNQPEVVARNAFAGAIEELAEREEIAPVVNMLKEGSLEVAVKGTEDNGETVYALLSDIEAGGKIYFSEDAVMVENLHAKYEDIDISANAYLGEDMIYVENGDILGGSWGVIRGEMADAFESSEWVEMLDMSVESEDAVVKLLEAYDDGIDKDLRDDVDKYVEKYTKLLIESVEEHAEYESETKEVKVGGERIDARVITITIDARTAISVMEDLYEELKDDEKLRETVIEYGAYVEDALVEAGEIDEGEDIGELYDEMLEDMGDAIDDLDGDEEGSIIIEMVTPKLSATMLKLTVLEEYEGEEEEIISIDVGEDGMRDSNLISVTFDGDTAITYEIEENTSKEYSATLKLRSYDGTMTLAKLSIDSDDEFKLNIPEADMTVSGAWTEKGDTTTIVVNRLRVDEITFEQFEITLIIDQKDRMPKPESKKDINNIFDLTEQDVEDIVERAENEIYGYVGDAYEEDAVDTAESDDVSFGFGW